MLELGFNKIEPLQACASPCTVLLLSIAYPVARMMICQVKVAMSLLSSFESLINASVTIDGVNYLHLCLLDFDSEDILLSLSASLVKNLGFYDEFWK